MSDHWTIVLSCEHAGNRIPPEYAGWFSTEAAREALASHRGWDPGSLELGRGLADALEAPLVVQTVSRLLVECNRSEGHPRLWSEFSRGMDPGARARILEDVWRRHREAVRRLVVSATAGAHVVHVGVHTFTPAWKGRPRATDIGILYDPRRAPEADVARGWKDALGAALSPRPRTPGRRTAVAAPLQVHLNRPYRGWTDGLTTTLRSEHEPSRYLGLELEVSQARVPLPPALVGTLASTLRAAIERVFG